MNKYVYIEFLEKGKNDIRSIIVVFKKTDFYFSIRVLDRVRRDIVRWFRHEFQVNYKINFLLRVG